MDTTTEENTESVLHRLAETPHRIAHLRRKFNEVDFHQRPDEKTWSVNEILAHLRSCADVWGKTITEMLTKDTPTLAHISPRTYIRKTDYPKLKFEDSFEAYSNQRKTLVNTLGNLNFEGWSRGAMIKERRHTVFSQVRRMAQHEDVHCNQIEEILGSLKS